MRIDVPTNPDKLIKLARKILTQHAELGAASPLNNIEEIEKFEPQTDAAAAQNDLASDLYKQAETATQLRDKALGQSGQLREGTVRHFVTASRDLLAGANKGKEQKLGVWGFEVDASPAPAKATKAAAAKPTA